MNTSSSQTLLNAALYSAKMHRQQRRKGASAEPYINHCIEVAQVLADLGGVRDTELLCAALLHDTVEDTEASPQDILARFGPEVASIVAEVTDDKSLPRADRKRLQIEHAPHKSDQAKQLKLADKLCNVRDLVHDPPDDWDQERILGYFDWAEKVVAGLRGSNLPIEAEIDHWLQAGRATFNAAAT